MLHSQCDAQEWHEGGGKEADDGMEIKKGHGSAGTDPRPKAEHMQPAFRT